jgi:radical SAM protein with 4Fe4S-binding SPASM domain
MLNTMATNGILIDKNIARKLKEVGVSTVIITIDSLTPKIHNELRGKDSWEQAYVGAQHCKDIGLLTMIESVATNKNCHEIGILKTWAEKEGFLYFYRPMHRGGRATDDSLMMSPTQYKKLFFERNEHIFQKINQGKGTHIPLFEIFDMVPFAHNPQSKEEKEYLEWGVGCQACRLIHGISTDGQLLPCIRLKTPLGNLLTTPLTEIMKKDYYQKISNRQRRSGICQNCESLEMCGGGCLAETFILKGDACAGWDRCQWIYPEKIKSE